MQTFIVFTYEILQKRFSYSHVDTMMCAIGLTPMAHLSAYGQPKTASNTPLDTINAGKQSSTLQGEAK
jgi:hypothetical protein